MKKNLSNKKMINLASQIKIDPSEDFIFEMKKEFQDNPDGICFENTIKEGYSMSKKLAIAVGTFCIILVLGIVVKMNVNSKTASADEGYSFVKYELNSTVEVTNDFIENQNISARMQTSFLKNLPYKGIYKASEAKGSYSVDLIKANQFPDYYAGSYINEDGKLIVQIKDSYYEKKYRSCDWYKELAEMMGSDDFACHPVKYNYTDLINGMSEITEGALSDKFKKEGFAMGSDIEFEIVGIGLNDYLNCVEVEIRNKEMADRIKSILDDEIYVIVVVGDVGIKDN